MQDLLTQVHIGDDQCIDDLLNEISECVTAEDNALLSEKPSLAEVKKSSPHPT